MTGRSSSFADISTVQHTSYAAACGAFGSVLHSRCKAGVSKIHDLLGQVGLPPMETVKVPFPTLEFPLTPVVNGIGQLIDFVDPFDVFQPSWPSWEPILDIIHLRIGGEWELRPDPGFGDGGLRLDIGIGFDR